jgi:hypothetical protein
VSGAAIIFANTGLELPVTDEAAAEVQNAIEANKRYAIFDRKGPVTSACGERAMHTVTIILAHVAMIDHGEN